MKYCLEPGCPGEDPDSPCPKCHKPWITEHQVRPSSSKEQQIREKLREIEALLDE